MTPPQHNDQNKRSTTSIHLIPKHWSTRTKIIASIAALALVLTGVGVTFAYRAYTVERDCKIQSKVFEDQKSEIAKAIPNANEALGMVLGDKPTPHTDGFSTSPENQKAIDDLSKALSKVNEHTNDEPLTCSDGKTLSALTDLTGARQVDLDALKTQTAAFIDVRDKYRLTKAADEAQSSMDKAKTDLATAQKNATDQLKAVEADSALQGDATVKSRYDALKKIEKDSHSVSTTVTVSTYDEAVASIEKTTTVVSKTGEVNTATQALKDAIKAYNDAKAAQAQSQAASGSGATSEYSGGGGSNGSDNSGFNDWSDTGGSSHDWSGSDTYTPPAPAPAPAPPSNNGGWVDFGIDPNVPNEPGCHWIEGKEYC